MCYHYGRWARHPALGWCWVPGYEWAPSWVTWYTYGNYIGWAPIAPVGFGVAYTLYPSDWCFVNFSYFLSPCVWSFYVSPWFVCGAVCGPYVVYNNCYFFGNRYYYGGGRPCNWYGPPVHVVERHVNRRITPYNLASTGNRAHNGRIARNTLEVYRPGMREGGALARTDGGVRAERVEKQVPPTGARGGSDLRKELNPGAGTPGRVERIGTPAGDARKELNPGAGTPGRVERIGTPAGDARKEVTPGAGTPGRVERIGTPAGDARKEVTPGAGTPGRVERIGTPAGDARKEVTPGAGTPGTIRNPVQVPRSDLLRRGWSPSSGIPSISQRQTFAPAAGVQPRVGTPSNPISAPRYQTPRAVQPSMPSAPVQTPRAPSTPTLPSAPRINQPSMPPAAPRMPSAPNVSSAPRVSTPSMPAMPRMSAPSMPSAPSMSSMPRMSAPSMPAAGGQVPIQMGGGRR
jgi:hypothetical protein